MRFLHLSTSRPLFVVAGFQASISGRFWVSTEEHSVRVTPGGGIEHRYTHDDPWILVADE
jgi:hypothetical protein